MREEKKDDERRVERERKKGRGWPRFLGRRGAERERERETAARAEAETGGKGSELYFI